MIADTLSWSLAFSVPRLESALLRVAIVAASMLAPIYLALLARRVLARDILAPEWRRRLQRLLS